MHSPTHSEFDPRAYPRTYTTSRGYRNFLIILGGCSSLGALVATFFIIASHDFRTPSAKALALAVSTPFLLFGIYVVVQALSARLILHPDSVELRDAFSAKSMRRVDIASTLSLPTQYVATLVVTPKQPDLSALKVPMYFSTDAVFRAWFHGIPDFSDEERARSQADLEAAAAVDRGGREAVAERIAKARATAKALNWIAGIAVAAGLVIPQSGQTLVTVLAAIPLIALALLLRWKGIYQIEGRRNDSRPSLAFPFIFPGMILTLHVTTGIHLLEWRNLLLAATVPAVLLAMIIVSGDPGIRNRAAIFVLMTLLMFAYVSSVAAHIDVLMDHLAPTIYAPSVEMKRVTHGRGGPTYLLRIAPWGPVSVSNEVRVPRPIFDSAAPGRPVSIYLHAGALKVPWFNVLPPLPTDNQERPSPQPTPSTTRPR
jgi:hypothetical protein